MRAVQTNVTSFVNVDPFTRSNLSDSYLVPIHPNDVWLPLKYSILR